MEEYEKFEEGEKAKKRGRQRAHTIMYRRMEDAGNNFEASLKELF